MLGLGTEVLLAGGGNILGIISGLLANAQRFKADQQKLMMERLAFDAEQMKIRSELANKEFELRSKDRFSSITRRILVLGFLVLIAVISLAPMFSQVDIAVPIEMTSGNKYLFGLIDTTKTWTEWQVIKSAAMWREAYDHVLLSIFAFYIGSSAVKR